MGQGLALSIRERRKALGLTQAELARAAEVSLRTVKGWESGETRPSIELAIRLAAVLQTSIETLAA